MTPKHEEFIAEMQDRRLKDEFYAAIKKEPEEFEDVDLRALIQRMGYLSDDERYKFRNLLVEENLTSAEKKRYQAIYPERTGGGLFGKYFPKAADVEEHYKRFFTRGRTQWQ